MSRPIKKDTEKYIVVFVTARDAEEAERVSRGLLEKKLIACATLQPLRYFPEKM